MSLFASLFKTIKSGSSGPFSGISFEFLSCIMLNKKGFFGLVTDREVVEEASVVFEDKIGSSVFCFMPLSQEVSSLGFNNYYHSASLASFQNINRVGRDSCVSQSRIFGMGGRENRYPFRLPDC